MHFQARHTDLLALTRGQATDGTRSMTASPVTPEFAINRR
jgi:hypothetical protein